MLLFVLYSLGVLSQLDSVNARQSGQATYFAVGLGACGGVNVPADFIVALNHEQFDVGTSYPSPMCGRGLTIDYKGKSAHATVADRCPGCAYGDLDMSVGLFSYLEDLEVGRFTMSWSWDGESPTEATLPVHTKTLSGESSRTQAGHSNTPHAPSSTIPTSQNSTSLPQAPPGPVPTLNPSPAVLLKVNNVVINLGNLVNLAAMHP